ncbi:MAG TPA: hypothetical protein VD994_07010 [Prosthecobacter sp.]|nr:hypothetical protein [Prosthecobacter sp.]
MPPRIEVYQDSPTVRAQLVSFLERSFRTEGACTEEQWRRRLTHWWDDNPFAQHIPHRGWVFWEENQIRGFLGVIPASYVDGLGDRIPALIATSWAVDEPHRNSALAMGFRFHRMGVDHLLVDTTPSPPVQAMLRHHGWTEQRQIRRRYLLRALARRILSDAVTLEPNLRIIQDVSQVITVAQQRKTLSWHKEITPEYLRWFVAAPMREHRFLGVANEYGQLTSYIIATPQSAGGIRCWSVMDWYTTRDHNHELEALVAALARHPEGWGGRRWPLLSLASFPPEDCWKDLPRMLERWEEVCHFHWLPPHLKAQPKRTALAEGDWGL